jgi:hypothetical protein
MQQTRPATSSLREFVLRLAASIEPRSSDLVQQVRGPEILSHLSAESGSILRVAYVELLCSSEASAKLLNGRRNLYNGPLQKAIEAALTPEAAKAMQVDLVRVQVLPPDQLETIEFGPREVKSVSWVAVDTAIAEGLISAGGPISSCCHEWGVKAILVRNGQVIGPSPAIADGLVALLPQLSRAATVFDPFAGTYLVDRIVRAIRSDITVNAVDRVDQAGNWTGLDAFEVIPKGEIDLMIVDPLYEDLLSYIRECLPRINFKLALVQTGETFDLAWNNAAARALRRFGRIADRSAWGKKMFAVVRDG